MKRTSLIRIVSSLILGLLLLPWQTVCAAEGNGKEGVDVKDVVLGHTSDSYGWHITTVGRHHVTIPLPIIVWSSSSGLHVFSSSRLTHEPNQTYQNFYIASSGAHAGKVCEQVNGREVKPLDLSITKNVAQMFVVVIVMLAIFLGCARWYKNKTPGSGVPRGFVGFMEMFVMMVNDDIIKSSIGEKHYRKYAPFLLTAFFFIFTGNLLGLVPVFPGGANLMGNITITAFLALCTFLSVNLFGNKAYWKDIFWPDVPVWLKVPVPIIPLIEFFGVFTKPFALAVRLFANMLAGHAIVLSLVCVIFVTCQLGAAIGTPLSLVSILMILFMDCLELLVAFLQAYIFTMLSAVFIGLAHQEEHE